MLSHLTFTKVSPLTFWCTDWGTCFPASLVLPAVRSLLPILLGRLEGSQRDNHLHHHNHHICMRDPSSRPSCATAPGSSGGRLPENQTSPRLSFFLSWATRRNFSFPRSLGPGFLCTFCQPLSSFVGTCLECIEGRSLVRGVRACCYVQVSSTGQFRRGGQTRGCAGQEDGERVLD